MFLAAFTLFKSVTGNDHLAKEDKHLAEWPCEPYQRHFLKTSSLLWEYVESQKAPIVQKTVSVSSLSRWSCECQLSRERKYSRSSKCNIQVC
mmetsp:Transcript_18317/g.23926  ORF Transcript_18317/g.23926 Transcript_18317/m.23926 type:complete len:92 (-) Transcript_18317:6-281(-)